MLEVGLSKFHNKCCNLIDWGLKGALHLHHQQSTSVYDSNEYSMLFSIEKTLIILHTKMPPQQKEENSDQEKIPDVDTN